MDHNETSSVPGDSTAAFNPEAQGLIQGLVTQAILRGHLRVTIPEGGVRSFPGLSGRVVARVIPELPSVVVKAGDTPALLAQARYLDDLATSGRLPAFLRRAFPRVYSISSELSVTPRGALHGYLMEDLSGHRMLIDRLLACAGPQEAMAVVDGVCAFLERAYTETICDGRPDSGRLYVEPTRACLEAAAHLDPRLDRGHRIVLRRNGYEVELPSWGTVIERTARALEAPASAVRTWAHGDLHAWNVLVPPNGDPSRVRLIDPVAGIDDLAHDMGRLIMSVRYAHLVDPNTVIAQPQLSVSGAVLTVDYDVPPQPAATLAAEAAIIDRVARFARSQGDREVDVRLGIATAAALLGDLPQLGHGEERRRHMALGAFAEGLLQLCGATGLVRPAA